MKINIPLVLGLISIVTLVYLYRKNTKHSLEDNISNNLRWVYRKGEMSPVRRLPDLINEFGKPDSLISSPAGKAIWGRRTMYATSGFLERLELRDEMIPHDSPAPHFDFLYAWFRIDLPSHLVCALEDISTSISYDPLTKLVQTRCHFMGANYATLTLAKKLANGEMTAQEAKCNYANYIFATVKDHELYDPLAEERYKNELQQYYNDHKVDCFALESNPDKCRA